MPASPDPNPLSAPFAGQRWLRRLRLSQKVVLGAGLLLLPTGVLLYYFNLSVNAAMSTAALERCGLAYGEIYHRMIEQSLAGAPATTLSNHIAELRALDQRPCADQVHDNEPQLSMAAAGLTRLAAGPPAAFQARALELHSEVGDHFNLILDPELDTYYIADFLFNFFPEAVQLLSTGTPPDPEHLQSHLQRLRRGLASAIRHNDYHPGSRQTLDSRISEASNRYLAALADTGSQAGRERARSALFALYGIASTWEDAALAARIEDGVWRKRRTYAIIALTLLTAGVFAWLMVRDSVRRLTGLVGVSRRLAQGDWAQSIEVTGSDEVAVLQGTFKTMAGELRQLYGNLEQRVQERTAAAHAAETRFRSVLESAPEAILLTDASGKIVLINKQVEKLFGYTREELIGQAVEKLVPATARERHREYRGAYGHNPSSRPMGAGRNLYGRRKDGSEVPIEIGLSQVQTADGPCVLASVIDISQRKATEKLLREAEVNALRGAILHNLPTSVIATDTAGTIVSVNPAAERLLGYRGEDLLGQSSMMIHDQEEVRRRAQELSTQFNRNVAADFEVFAAAGSQSQTDEREWTFIRKDGSLVPVQMAVTALRDDGGRITGFLKVAHDISARKRAEAYIHHMAYHDALTGLPNRALLMDRLGVAMRQAQRHGQKLAVLLMDLDHFKNINDSLGHQVGDQLLVTIADRLEHAARSIDTVTRLGGDEFVFIVSDVQSREDVAPVVAKLLEAVTRPLSIEDHELRVTPSIGACLYPDDGSDALTLLKKADTAMYQAKKARGGNAARWFTEAMLQESQEKLLLGLALRQALDHKEFSIHYQPELSLRTGRVIGIEALLRWQHGGASVSPGRFIAIAEESGLILPLGEWVLRRACHECVQLQQQVNRRLTVAVNVSPYQFQQKEWLRVVASALEDSGLHPNLLELEITETVLMQNPEESAETLRAIRQLGVGVVIDDFGTGYSSLAYLTRFPVDKIKIDRSFVRNLTTDTADAAVVNAIIAMAQRLGIRVIAEGVESLELQHYLQQQGCDEAQGFLYSSGLALKDLAQKLDLIESTAKGPSAQPEDVQVA